MKPADFHRQFVENQRRVYGYVRTLLPDIAAAEEAFQNACVVILSKADQFEAGTNFAAWACQISHFEVLNLRRRWQKDRLIFRDELLELIAAEHIAANELLEQRRRALKSCLDRLPPSDRELVESRYQEPTTARGLAERLGRPANTVYKALGRIRDSLRQCINAAVAREATA